MNASRCAEKEACPARERLRRRRGTERIKRAWFSGGKNAPKEPKRVGSEEAPSKAATSAAQVRPGYLSAQQTVAPWSRASTPIEPALKDLKSSWN